jgi:hypothetical protein
MAREDFVREVHIPLLPARVESRGDRRIPLKKS